MKKLIIKRKNWLRGEADSYLLRPHDHKRCCVGIYLASEGVEDKDLIGKAAADSVEKLPQNAIWLIQEEEHSEDANKLYQINDERNAIELDREQNIKTIFSKHGIAIEFVE